MLGLATGGVELIDLDRPLGELRQDLKLAAESFDDLLQRRDLDVALLFQLREARLLDAERRGHFALALAGQFADLAEQEFPKQFLGAAGRLGLRPFRGRPLDQFVE